MNSLYIKDNNLVIGEISKIVSNIEGTIINWDDFLISSSDSNVIEVNSIGVAKAYNVGYCTVKISDKITGQSLSFDYYVFEDVPFMLTTPLGNGVPHSKLPPYSIRFDYSKYFDCCNTYELIPTRVGNDFTFVVSGTKINCPEGEFCKKELLYTINDLEAGTYTVKFGDYDTVVTFDNYSSLVSLMNIGSKTINIKETSEISIYGLDTIPWENFTLTSSNPNIATVSEDGIIEGIGLGMSTITVTDNITNDSQSFTIEIVVPYYLKPMVDFTCFPNTIDVVFVHYACGEDSLSYTIVDSNIYVTSVFTPYQTLLPCDITVIEPAIEYLRIDNLAEGRYNVFFKSDVDYSFDTTLILYGEQDILKTLDINYFLSVGQTSEIYSSQSFHIDWDKYTISVSDTNVIQVASLGTIIAIGEGKASVIVTDKETGENVVLPVWIWRNDVPNLTLYQDHNGIPNTIFVHYTDYYSCDYPSIEVSEINDSTFFLNFIQPDCGEADCNCPEDSIRIRTLTAKIEGLSAGNYTVTDGTLSQTITLVPQSLIYRMRFKNNSIPVGSQTEIMLNNVVGYNWDNYTITSLDESIATVDMNMVTAVDTGICYIRIVDNISNVSTELTLYIQPVLSLRQVNSDNPNAIEISYLGFFDCNTPTIVVSEITDNSIFFHLNAPKCGDAKCACPNDSLYLQSISTVVDGLALGTYTVTDGTAESAITLNSLSLIYQMYLTKSKIKIGEIAYLTIDYLSYINWDNYVIISSNDTVVKVDKFGEVAGVGIGNATISIMDLLTGEMVSFNVSVVDEIFPIIEVADLTSSGWKPNAIKIALTNNFDCCNSHGLTQYVSNDTIYLNVLSTEMYCETPDTCLQTLTTLVEGLDYGTYVINYNFQNYVYHTISNVDSLFFLERNIIKVGETTNIYWNSDVTIPIHWELYNLKSSSDSVVTVSTMGVVTGVGAGQADMTIEEKATGEIVKLYITVENSFEPKFEISQPPTSSVYKPYAIQIDYTVNDCCNVFSIEDSIDGNNISIAVISTLMACDNYDCEKVVSKVIENLPLGTYNIIFNNEIIQTITLVGLSNLEQLSLEDNNLFVGEKTQITWVLKMPIAWGTQYVAKSADESVATVSEDGIVKAIGEGTTTIIVTDNETGESINLTITVQKRNDSIKSIKVSTDGFSLEITFDKPITLYVGIENDFFIFKLDLIKADEQYKVEKVMIKMVILIP
ncbi:MAG: Ig-like domain-containing protein [Bacteroidales bacterium]|nr:Ig-like domain-containing protein [Bacteroidales bacterium]